MFFFFLLVLWFVGARCTMHDGKGVDMSRLWRSSSHHSGVRQRGQAPERGLICDVLDWFLQYVFELLQFVMSLQLSEGSRTDVGQSAVSELRNSPCGWHANGGRALRISPTQFLSYQSDHFRLGRCWMTAAHQSSVSGRCGRSQNELLARCSFVSHQKHYDFLEKRFFRWRHRCCHPPLWLFQWFQSREHGCDRRAEHLFTTTPSNLDPTPASPLALCAAAHTWTK